MENYKIIKKELIKKIIKVSFNSKEGHIASSLSILDLLFAIYKYEVIKNKSIFVLSKGHASLGIYCILDYFNLLKYDLNSFCNFDSILGGHPNNKINGIECSSGSLGHGMPFALGIALAKKILNQNEKVITIIGDGEANEGTIWETALLASNHKLNNFYCILDYNRSNDRALKLDSLIEKFKSFGWECFEINGHSIEDIKNVLNINTNEKPVFILANTTKGKGCKLMEDNPEWHHKSPENENQLEELIKIVDFY